MLIRFLIILLLFCFIITGCGPDQAYEGETKNDLPHGSGTLIYQGGAVYEGEFKKGNRCGEGCWEHPDGITYEGQWKDDYYHGYGTLCVPGHFTYEGHFKAGLKHGYGMQTWADGHRYEGEWQEGRRHGQGVMVYPDGSRFEGQWEEGRKVGEGTLYEANGEITSGEWEEDQIQQIPVETIALNHSELNLVTGEDPVELTAEISPEDAATQEISWSSSDPEVATVEDGLVTPKQSGEATITAVAEDISSECTVTVTAPAPPLEELSIEQPWLNMRLNDEPERLVLQVEPPGADLEGLQWSSENPEIATVDQQGLVTPQGMGETLITVQSQDGAFIDTCRVAIRRPLSFDTN